MVRNFWQQFPKEFNIKSNEFTLYLHPTRASMPSPDLKYPKMDISTGYIRPNTFYAPKEGMAKSYEMLLYFHKDNYLNAQISKLNAIFQKPPLLEAQPKWYCETSAFGKIIEAGHWSAGYDAHYNLLPLGSLPVYGWRDFADRLRGGWEQERDGILIPEFFNDQHTGMAHSTFTHYLRTENRNFYDYALNTTRHWMDIDVTHTIELRKSNGKHFSPMSAPKP